MKYGWWEFIKDVAFLLVVFVGGSSLDYELAKVYSLGILILATVISANKTSLVGQMLLKRDLGDMILIATDKTTLKSVEAARLSNEDTPDYIDASVRHLKEKGEIDDYLSAKKLMLNNWAVWVLWVMGLFGLFNG